MIFKGSICLIFLFFIKLGFSVAINEDDLIVQLPQGKIRGHVLKTNRNISVYAYHEIPYAAPPIGKLRFMSPKEPTKWEGIRDATKGSKVCHQWGSNSHKTASEDCLYINVYTPIKPGSSGKLPIYAYIHGGAYMYGDGLYGFLGPQYLINQNIIVVTLNYRLGPFGFLSTQDDVILGNQGLKDQAFALQWIQKNIHLFGGDPTKVTVSGQSAGAMSVGLHILSKKSAGLFRAAVIESGSALHSVSYQRYAKSVAHELCHAIDPKCTNATTSKELLEILQKVDANVLNTAKVVGPNPMQINQGLLFSPVIEVKHPEAFLSEKQHVALERGEFNKVPLLIGIVSEEWLMEAKDVDGYKKKMKHFDEHPELLVPEDLNVLPKDRETVGKAFRSLYTNGLFQNDRGASVRYKSDVRYCLPVVRHAYLQSAFTDVFLYQFSYHGILNNNNFTVPGAERVSHAEELQFIWHISNYNDNLSKFPAADVRTLEQMTFMWGNFVKYLNPTPEKYPLLNNITWPLLKPKSLVYLNINHTWAIEKNPKQYLKWIEIIDKYGHPPFDSF